MTRRNGSRGAITLVIVVVVLLVAALGFVGWRMLTRQSTDQAAHSTETSAEVIMTQDDLDEATKSLDEIDFSDEDAAAAELQAEL